MRWYEVQWFVVALLLNEGRRGKPGPVAKLDVEMLSAADGGSSSSSGVVSPTLNVRASFTSIIVEHFLNSRCKD